MRFAVLALVPLLAAQPAADPAWVAPMRDVHAKFTGTPGTLALFGDSITNSFAFWAPLEGAKLAGDAAARCDGATTTADCWRKWRGEEYGNKSRMTIRWADENLDGWLKKLNPEAAVLLFGTNDMGLYDAKEYEARTRSVVERLLEERHGGADDDAAAAERDAGEVAGVRRRAARASRRCTACPSSTTRPTSSAAGRRTGTAACRSSRPTPRTCTRCRR